MVTKNVRKKSSKDIAFEKEKSKFRHEITDLKRSLREQLLEIQFLKQTIRDKDEEIREKQETIQELSKYAKMSEKDLEDFHRSRELLVKCSGFLHLLNVMDNGVNSKFT